MRSKVDKLVELLKRKIVEALLEVFGQNLVSVVLYGSYARGDFRPDSDIDVLIILERLPEDRFELHRMLDQVEEKLKDIFEEFRSLGYNPVLSPIVLDKAIAARFRPLYIDLVFDAIILFDKDNFMYTVLNKVRKKLAELGARRVYIGKIWVVDLKPGSRFGEIIDLSLDENEQY